MDILTMSGKSGVERKLNVMLIDDQPLVREYVKTGLQDFVEACHTGAGHEDFMCLIERDRYDIIILDHALPQVSGMEILCGIRSGEFSCPYDSRVVMVTGYGDIGIVSQAKTFDIDNLIAKPFSISTLIQKIKGVMQRPSIKRDVNYYRACLHQSVERACTLKRIPPSVVMPGKPLWYTAMELDKARMRAEPSRVDFIDLETGMRLAENIYSPAGQLLAGEGVQLTERIIQRLQLFSGSLQRNSVRVFRE